MIEDALLVELSFGVETFVNTVHIWPENAHAQKLDQAEVSVTPLNFVTSILD